MNKPKNVVIIGGGHGQSAICRGIKNIENLKISAIVTVADDGGSTGRLRKRFHIPAMAESESLMGNLMDYRFEDTDGDESDVGGHNLGNLILTALTQQCGSFMEAVQTIGKVLNVKGNIIPATTQVITLYAMMDDGVIVKGEANIPARHNRIRKVFYQEPVHAVPEAVAALKNADLIIYGIGSVYTSILPNIIIDEMRDALNASKAKKVYFCNAMTQPGETDGFSLEDHVEALQSHGAPVDEVVFASDSLPEKLIARYAEEGSIPVIENTCSHSYKVRHENLLNFSSNLIRHDSLKIERAVRKLVEEL